MQLSTKLLAIFIVSWVFSLEKAHGNPGSIDIAMFRRPRWPPLVASTYQMQQEESKVVTPTQGIYKVTATRSAHLTCALQATL